MQVGGAIIPIHFPSRKSPEDDQQNNDAEPLKFVDVRVIFFISARVLTLLLRRLPENILKKNADVF